MNSFARRVVAHIAIASLSLLVATESVADSISDFYRGKEIKIIVAAGAGGGWGLNARLLSNFLGKYIPGEPTVIPQFMPGASGMRATNYLYNAAPRDGTELGLLLKEIDVAQRLNDGAKYEADKMIWIGRIAPVRSVAFVWHRAPATTIEAIKKTEIVAGSLGKDDQSYVNLALLNHLAGTKIRIIPGFRGSADVLLAMEKGEMHAWSGSWDTMKAQRGQWLKDREIIPLVQFSLTVAPDLPKIPLLTDFAGDDKRRAMAEFLAGGSDVGLSISAPPGVPDAQIQALRAGFTKTMQDKEFIAAMEKAGVSLEPATGEEVAAIIKKMTRIPADTLEELKRAIE